ncbi:hypothetical protein [Aeromonas finlandensis]
MGRVILRGRRGRTFVRPHIKEIACCARLFQH